MPEPQGPSAIATPLGSRALSAPLQRIERMGLPAFLSLGLFGCLLVGRFLGGIQAQGCPPEWRLAGGHCYGFFPNGETFPDAVVKCKKEGGGLAVVAHDQQPTEIKDFLRYHKVKQDVWIRVLNGTIQAKSYALDHSTGFLTWKQVPEKNKLPYVCTKSP
ncbi:hypothetical protein lerEdw1_010661 [Lerista edwardsae]|nr:hypothetical protein lerEdw1_010661 [Lerista edwardsae]